MVFRVHKNENYTTMSNYHLRDKGLSLKAKGLLSLMLSLKDDWDYSTKGLTTLSSDGETSVRGALKELEICHYLKRTPIRVGGIIKDWDYDIYEIPQSIEDEPHVENQHVDNCSQINTKEVNTKESNNTFTDVKVEQPTVTQQPKRRIKLVDTPNVTVNYEKSKGRNLFKDCLEEIDKFTDDEEIRDLLKTYLPIRLSRKDVAINLPSFRGMLKRLRRVAETREQQIESIQQSIDRQYPTFYEVKKYNNYKKKFAEGDGLKMGMSENEEIADEVF